MWTWIIGIAIVTYATFIAFIVLEAIVDCVEIIASTLRRPRPPHLNREPNLRIPRIDARDETRVEWWLNRGAH